MMDQKPEIERVQGTRQDVNEELKITEEISKEPLNKSQNKRIAEEKSCKMQ